MTDLTSLTLAEARDRLKSRAISSVEITKAHLEAIERSEGLNTFVAVTADKALQMAEASDARLAAKEAAPLEGLPIGVKDLYATEGVHTQACSHILDGLQATLRIDRHREFVARRRGDAGQAQYGRVRHGLVERDLLLRARRVALAAAQLEPRQRARGGADFR